MDPTKESTRHGRRPRRRFQFRAALVRIVALGPLTCGVSLFLMLLSAQAMYGEKLVLVGDVVLSMFAEKDSLPAAAITPSPIDARLLAAIPPDEILPDTETPVSASAQAFQPEAITLTPSTTSTSTATATSTTTKTETPTSTLTLTATLTATGSSTPYPTWTPRPSSTPSRTPQPTRTFTPGPTATPSQTLDPSIPTDTRAPTQTNTPIFTSCTTSLNLENEDAVVQLINAERQSRGLHAYAVQSQLRAAARVHAADMACNHFLGHTGSDGSTVRDRVTAQGYTFSWIGENYMVSQNPRTAFDWWMNSGPHTANILSPNYTEFGVGYIYSSESDYGGYFVIVFARP